MTANPAPDGAEPVPPDSGEAAATAGLRALSDTYPSLPSAVAERLDRTLAELPDLSAPETPAPASPPKTPWWRRRYALASAALGIVAFLGGGVLIAVQPWASPGVGTSANSESRADAGSGKLDKQQDGSEHDDAAPDDDPGLESEESAYTVSYTGRDYSQADLTGARGLTSTGDRARLAPELETLSSDKATRDACLSELTGTYGGTVKSVDFGRFEGDPAMVAVLEADKSGGVVAAVGSGCRPGAPGLLGSASY